MGLGKCGQCRCIHSSPPVIVVLSLVTFDPYQHLFKSAVKLSNQSFPLAAQKTSGVKGKRDSRVDQTVTSRLASVTLSIFARSGARQSVSLHLGRREDHRATFPVSMETVGCKVYTVVSGCENCSSLGPCLWEVARLHAQGEVTFVVFRIT